MWSFYREGDNYPIKNEINLRSHKGFLTSINLSFSFINSIINKTSNVATAFPTFADSFKAENMVRWKKVGYKDNNQKEVV